MRPIPFHVLTKTFGEKQSLQKLVSGVAIDSRKVKPGDLFFALSGNKVEGDQFLHEAKARGAIGAVVKKEFQKESEDLPLIRVSNVLDALQMLAKEVLSKMKTKVVAITGSLGKTTTKDFTTTLLRSTYKVASSPLSYNSQATLPLSILLADGDEDILILEMGISKPGEMERLVAIAPPDIAVLTTISIQHTCHFSEGLIGIVKEKGKIFSHKKTKIGICHKDIEHYDEVSSIGLCDKINFSLISKNANYFLEILPGKIKIYPQVEPPLEIEFGLPLKPHYQNYLAAVAVARSFGVPWSFIKDVSPTLKLPPMRFERVEREGIVFINDAYNANPDSMKAALEQLPEPKSGCKVIAVLGEMTELGKYSEEGHSLVAKTALLKCDILLCLGSFCKIMQQIWEEEGRHVEHFDNFESLLKALKIHVQSGDVVLLKGARSLGLEKILESFK